MQSEKSNHAIIGDFQGFEVSSNEGTGKPRKEEKSTDVEKNIQRGQSLVVAGFGVSIVGMVFYCYSMFTLDESVREISQLAVQTWLGLGAIGAGVILWLVGNILHLNALMETNGEEEK